MSVTTGVGVSGGATGASGGTASTALGAAETARRVKSGSLTVQDTVEQALERIVRHDAVLAAFVNVRADAARREAADVQRRVAAGDDLPLAGVPVAVKDDVAITGEVMRAGSKATDRDPQPGDHPVVARLRAAGAVIVGTTALPEASLWLTTDGDRITRNPWNIEFSSSGSSGGSAAAVASGMVPIAHGNDGLGSLRQPAAACGLLGIKPSHGRVPAEIGLNDWYGLVENGPLARSAADLGLMLSVMAGDRALADVRPLRRPLRIAVSVRTPVQGTRTDAAITKEVFAAAALLGSQGHHVTRDQPTYPQRLSLAGTFRWFAAAADYVDGVAEPAEVEERTLGHASAGRRVRRLIRHEQLTDWRARVEKFFDRYDVLMTPVTATHPLRAEHWNERAWAANVRANVTASGGFCGMWNVAGFPAISIPFGVDPLTNTPIAVQLAAPHGSDALLLSLAASFEQWRPWPTVAPNWL